MPTRPIHLKALRFSDVEKVYCHHGNGFYCNDLTQTHKVEIVPTRK